MIKRELYIFFDYKNVELIPGSSKAKYSLTWNNRRASKKGQCTDTRVRHVPIILKVCKPSTSPSLLFQSFEVGNIDCVCVRLIFIACATTIARCRRVQSVQNHTATQMWEWNKEKEQMKILEETRTPSLPHHTYLCTTRSVWYFT